MNNNIYMNRMMGSALNETALDKRFQELLRGIDWLGEVETVSDPEIGNKRFDLMMRISVGGQKIEFWIECKTEIRPSQLPMLDGMKEALEQQAKHLQVPVLAARHVSPRLAQVCAERGWSWFDLAGNCRISVPGHLHLERSGNKSVAVKKRAGANLGSESAASVLRALMMPERNEAFWSQRALQAACKPAVSLGLVNKVVNHLRNEGYIAEVEKGGYALRDALQLLQAWREAYRFDRVKQIRCFTLLRANEIEERLVSLNKSEETQVAYASFSAAEIQAPTVRQPKKWLAVLKNSMEDVMETLEAKPVDSGDNVVLLVPPDEGMLVAVEDREARLPCTHPLQTYLDLCHSAGRGEEASEAILKQRLKPGWKHKGWLYDR